MSSLPSPFRPVVAASLLLGCSQPVGDLGFESGPGATATGTETETETGGTMGGTAATGGATDSAGTMGDSGTAGPGTKFDVGRMDAGGPVCPSFAGTGGDECDYTCTGVDIIFVIDNSVSMDVPQAAVAAAFPEFADAMVETLPEDISLHVGVTSTEMGLVTIANIPSPPNGCRGYDASTGQPMEDFYITPDTEPTPREGAQGRLFPALGQYYFEANTSDPASIDGLKTWFMSAAAIGTGGSNIEMSTAAAGWVGHQANDATNAGFIRDTGNVLVVFFIQDEPDQSPLMINGNPGGVEMLNQLARSKAGCGGTNCIIGGGMLNERCMGETAIGDFLAGLGAPPVVVQFPEQWPNQPSPPPVTPEDFITIFRDTLVGAILEKCKDLRPPG